MNGVSTMAYLIAGVLFIRSLGGLSHQESATEGNTTGMVGMALAVAVTAAIWLTGHGQSALGAALLVGVMVVGGAVGAGLARRVEMTGMPELVAMLHSFVGLAAVLVGASSYLRPPASQEHLVEPAARALHVAELWLGVAVGAVTFTGSVIAWGKLKGTFSGRALLLPGRHALNALLVGSVMALAVPFSNAPEASAMGLAIIALNVVLSGILGAHLVMAIGGADMPVVVSLLNSYSGWAAAAAGFVLGNDLLIVTGALVGSSGAILSIIMCRAMNRSILSVVFGGFGAVETHAAAAAPTGKVHELNAHDLVTRLREAREVIIVPGYGMAVARAQSPVAEFSRALRERGARVRFAIHPVAGRLPGHMNVLLAEAGVPYDLVFEMEDINREFNTVDVVLVIGANDIVNPGALDDPTSPIHGMPVLEVWKSRLVVVLKRGGGAGYAGVENPLFFLDNTRMLYGDARKSMESLVAGMREG